MIKVKKKKVYNMYSVTEGQSQRLDSLSDFLQLYISKLTRLNKSKTKLYIIVYKPSK